MRESTLEHQTRALQHAINIWSEKKKKMQDRRISANPKMRTPIHGRMDSGQEKQIGNLEKSKKKKKKKRGCIFLPPTWWRWWVKRRAEDETRIEIFLLGTIGNAPTNRRLLRGFIYREWGRARCHAPVTTYKPRCVRRPHVSATTVIHRRYTETRYSIVKYLCFFFFKEWTEFSPSIFFYLICHNYIFNKIQFF